MTSPVPDPDRPDPIAAISPDVRLGDRVSVRRRLPDGSATDVIGWVLALDATRIDLGTGPEAATGIERAFVLAARRVPPARGGRDPRRTSPAELQQLTVPAWADRIEPLGDWTLRDAAGFTRRANSCLAVGDPGMPIDRAAEQVTAHYGSLGLPPLAQVIADEPAERALTELGWTSGGPDTDLLVTRLADLIESVGEVGPDPADPEVRLSDKPDDAWLGGLLRQRGMNEVPPAGLIVLAGRPPVVFASVDDPHAGGNGLAAMARGQLSRDWLGVTAVWTRPDRRRQGLSVAVIAAISRWAAIRGARNVYLQVEHDNGAAQAAYAKLGFVRHHGYRYLCPPG